MKLTAGEIYDAIMGLVAIIRRPRMIPQMAKFKIARMHDTLEPHYKEIEDARVALVQKYGHEVFEDEEKTKSKGWQIDENSNEMKQYIAEWDAIRAQEREVNITPITLQSLGDSENGVEAGEFKYLRRLVVDVSETIGTPVGTA
jgi:hypothetical protein